MKTISSTYLDEKHLTPKSFFLFLKDNKPLVFISITTIFIVFGVKLTNICFGVDTELHIASDRYLNWMEIGRFGLVGLQKIWTNFLSNNELFNPCLAAIFGCSFLLSGVLLWCFVIDLFSNKSITKLSYIPFSILFISHQVWTEQIYFICQSAECLFIVLLSPVSVYLLFKGTCTVNLKKIIIGFLLAVFSVSIYQGVIMLICCAIFAMFLLFKENTELQIKDYMKICVILLLLMLGIVVFYFILDKAIRFIFHVEKSDYLLNMIGSEDRSFLIKILYIGYYFYKLMFSNITPLNELLQIFVAKMAETGRIAAEANVHPSLTANIIYAPALILFYISIFKNKHVSFLYVMAAIGVFLSIFALPIVGGGSAPLRSQYVLPFSISFILLYVTNSICNDKQSWIYKLSFVLFLSCGIKQVLCSAMLNYCDVMRYESDCRFSSEISEKISNVSTSANTPILFYGVHHPETTSNYVKGEVCGYSPFEWVNDKDLFDCTGRALAFLKTQGYNYITVKEDSIVQKARIEAESMPDFPAQGCVKNLGDVIVIRLSETSYKAE